MPAARTIESRDLAPQVARLRVEKRADDKRVITGYGAVFYRAGDPTTEYRIWSDLIERIMPGAFDAAIAEGDNARSFFNHDKNQVLGLRGSGTLRLSVDDVGLKFEVDPPDTQVGRDVVTLIERGDVPGSSFSFMCCQGVAKRGRTVWVSETIDGQNVDVREIHEVELFDIGPVMWPSYEATNVGVRSCSPAAAELLASERDRWRQLQTECPEAVAWEEIQLRARLVDVERDLLGL